MDGNHVGIGQQPAVAHGDKLQAADVYLHLMAEIVGKGLLQSETTRVVVYIVYHAAQLSLTRENGVGVVEFPKETTFTIGRLLHLFGYVGAQTAEMFMASFLEVADDIAHMFFEGGMDEENAMDVVGHQLEGDELDVWFESGDGAPFVANAKAEWGGMIRGESGEV